MDIFSSSVISIEGHNFVLIINDDRTGYRWLYGLKSKDDVLKAIKKWYIDIAELREKHKVIMVMRDKLDNAGENKSKEMIDILQSLGIQSRYSTPSGY